MNPPRMMPRELVACRAAFEQQDSCGYRDMAYDSERGKYVSLFTQGRWVNWQLAWKAGQEFLNSGGKTPIPPVPEPSEAPPRRISRVPRT